MELTMSDLSAPEKLVGFDRYKPYVLVSTTRWPINKNNSKPVFETGYISYIAYRNTRIWVSDHAYYVKDHGISVKAKAKLEATKILKLPPEHPISKLLERKCQDIDYRCRLRDHKLSLQGRIGLKKQPKFKPHNV